MTDEVEIPEPEPLPQPVPLRVFALYELDSGRIVQMNGAVDIESVLAICAEGQGAVEVDAAVADTTHYIKDGAAVAYPERPSPAHVWEPAAEAWVDPRTLAQRKADRIDAVQAARDAEIYGGFTWSGSPFDSNERSQSVLLGTFVDSQRPGFTSKTFRLADNTWRTLNAADVAGVWAALAAHVEGAFVRFATREAQINAATTPEAVDAISW